jgi:hypothetical protein
VAPKTSRLWVCPRQLLSLRQCTADLQLLIETSHRIGDCFSAASALAGKLPRLLILKHRRYVSGKITAVMEQTGTLDFFVNVAVEQEVARSFHAFGVHAFAAERQMIDIGVRRKVGARLCAGTCGILQHVA